MTIKYEEVKKILSGIKDGDKVLEYIDELRNHMSDIEGELVTMMSASEVLETDI